MDTRPGRRGSPRGAVSRAGPSRGLRHRFSGVLRRARAPLRLARWLPVRAEALAVRRSAFPFGRSLPVSPFAAPGPKPGPARRSRAEAQFHRWQRAGLRLACCRAGSRTCVRSPAFRLRFPKDPEPGRLTMPAAFASAQGQARSFRMAAASSAARPSLGEPPSGGTGTRFRSGCGWEGSRPSPVDRLGHGRKLSRPGESRQADSACG